VEVASWRSARANQKQAIFRLVSVERFVQIKAWLLLLRLNENENR